jgi:hypothetical protein
MVGRARPARRISRADSRGTRLAFDLLRGWSRHDGTSLLADRCHAPGRGGGARPCGPVQDRHQGRAGLPGRRSDVRPRRAMRRALHRRPVRHGNTGRPAPDVLRWHSCLLGARQPGDRPKLHWTSGNVPAGEAPRAMPCGRGGKRVRPPCATLHRERRHPRRAGPRSSNDALPDRCLPCDVERGKQVVQELDAGTGWVNQHMDITPFAPFGGAKWSGIGYENGRWGYEAFTELQVVNTRKA